MSSVTIKVSDEEANQALANPAFREILSLGFIFESIKDETGIEVGDYDSLEDYFFAYYSTFETGFLEKYKRVSSSYSKIIDAVLEARMIDETKYLTS